jgi:signal transduction histidine kinase
MSMRRLSILIHPYLSGMWGRGVTVFGLLLTAASLLFPAMMPDREHPLVFNIPALTVAALAFLVLYWALRWLFSISRLAKARQRRFCAALRKAKPALAAVNAGLDLAVTGDEDAFNYAKELRDAAHRVGVTASEISETPVAHQAQKGVVVMTFDPSQPSPQAVCLKLALAEVGVKTQYGPMHRSNAVARDVGIFVIDAP